MLAPMLDDAARRVTSRSLAGALCLAWAASAAGCASWDAEARAREQAIAALACEAVTVIERSELRFRVEGCGGAVEVLCSSGRNEPVCVVGRARQDERSAGLADVGAGGEEPEGEPSRQGSEDEAAAIEARIRSGLDARREEILACTGRSASVVRARYDASGAVTLTLAGDLEGSPEEGCVRAALSGVRVSPGHAGLVMHLVRHPAPRSSEPRSPRASDDASAPSESDGR